MHSSAQVAANISSLHGVRWPTLRTGRGGKDDDARMVICKLYLTVETERDS